MSLSSDLRTNLVPSFLSALPGAAGYAGARGARKKLLLAIDELIFLPVAALKYLPLVTKSARAEAQSISITRQSLGLRQWPAAFEGLKVAFLTDLHCGALTPLSFVARVVAETNRLKPDLILLGGDYVTKGTDYVRPVVELLAKLQAPLGVYSVLGNHDCLAAPDMITSALKQAGIVDVNNGGRWLTSGRDRIRIAGVGDLWEDKQDLQAALSGATADDAVILLSHNPDYAMQLHDPRVRLVLSGHTHGGQICLPKIGAVLTNSNYGQRLVSGLVEFDTFKLYTSRGLGTVVVPMRYRCPPEITLLTLSNRK